FTMATMASKFKANEAQCQNKEQGASFNGMKVGSGALFHDSVFDGPVNFNEADIAIELNMNGAKFQHKGNTASFIGMKVRGYAFFNDVVAEGSVDFRYADFAWLDLSSSSWKTASWWEPPLYMQGMSYKYIRSVPGPGNEPESHTALLKLANQSAYTAD